VTLRFEILGVEFLRLTLDIEQGEPTEVNVLDKGIKSMSRWWVGRMGK
jgi:hypothetical protein